MTKQWTSEQQSFIDACGDGESPISLRAVAGAGKTSVLVEGVSEIVERQPLASVTCVAFNKSTAVELDERMPAGVWCKTMNSVGHSAWGKHIGLYPRGLKLSQYKTHDTAKELWGSDFKFPEGLEDVPRLVALAKQSGIVLRSGHEGSGLTPDSTETWTELIDEFGLMIPEEFTTKAIGMARDLLHKSVKMAFDGIIDFDDQLYMPVCFGGSWWKSERVLIDEAQDISGIQREMLRNMLTSEGQLIAVGDPRQAIYGFRGAASDSMDRIKREFHQEPMQLTYTFRCSKAVTKEASNIVHDIKCPDSAVPGDVLELDRWNLSAIPSNAAIVCRNTQPLVDIAFRLISRNIKCHVLGRDIGAGLVRLIDMMKADDLETLEYKLLEYQGYQTAKYNALGRPERVESIQDRVLTVTTCIACLTGGNTVDDLKKSIKSLFDDMKGGICLTTIHKAKGLEWNIVYFLDSDLIPSRFATQGWQLEQEENLKYVAITRALVDLIYVYSQGAE